MADNNKTIDRSDITFYLLNSEWKLNLKECKIYSPYNEAKKNDKWQFIWEMDFVTFKKWVYVLSMDEVIHDYKYDQFKEFLSFYNRKWWRLTKWVKIDWTDKMNWRIFKWKWFINTVSMEEPKKLTEKEVVVQTKDVIVNSIPKVVAETMTHIQLDILAKKWEVEVPTDILESWDNEAIKKRYFDILKEHITD